MNKELPLLPATICVALLGILVGSSGPTTVAAAAEKRPCDYITAAEVNAIVHGQLKASQTGSETCTYSSSGPGPYAQVKVALGDGRVAMQVYSHASSAKQGADSRLAGVGDQAVAVGPALMVRKGEDLVEITMSGVTQPIEKAKRIFSKVQSRM